MLEGLFSRHLEEYLSNGKHSVVLVAFVATMIPRLLSSNILTTWGTQGPACLQMDQTSGRNWDPFVPGLLLTRTTGQSAPTGETTLHQDEKTTRSEVDSFPKMLDLIRRIICVFLTS